MSTSGGGIESSAPHLDMNPKNLKYAPRLIFFAFWGLIYYTFLEVEMFFLAIVAALFGWQLGWEWGITIYFSVYLVWRLIGSYISVLTNIRGPSGPVTGRSEENVNE